MNGQEFDRICSRNQGRLVTLSGFFGCTKVEVIWGVHSDIVRNRKRK